MTTTEVDPLTETFGDPPLTQAGIDVIRAVANALRAMFGDSAIADLYGPACNTPRQLATIRVALGIPPRWPLWFVPELRALPPGVSARNAV